MEQNTSVEQNYKFVESVETIFDPKNKVFLCSQNDNFPLTERLDYAAKCLVEGTIFINPNVSGTTGKINGQSVHLCSHQDNPNYNQGQKFIVELKNISANADNAGKNINVFCYDTQNGNKINLFGNEKIEFSDLIDSAKIVVTHGDGEPASISIDCVDVEHRLLLDNVSKHNDLMNYDYRSADSYKYCEHKNIVSHVI